MDRISPMNLKVKHAIAMARNNGSLERLVI